MEMTNSRSKNLFLNVTVGYVVQICILALSFIGRSIFIRFLSADYLGINGLYSNILSVLALAELGLGNVMQFFLYKPVGQGDQEKTVALFKYFKKLYLAIAGIVLAAGLLLIPSLRYIVNSELPQDELIIYYILFLLNSVVTYFAAPHIALLAANQDNRLQKMITLFTTLILQLAHIVVLLIWKNYIIYVTVTLVSTVLNTLILSASCNKRYPYLRKEAETDVSEKREVIKSVKATFVYKVGSVIINNTTNILISIIISTAAVGLYSNYYLIVNGIQAFIAIITASLISGVGNLSTQGNRKRMYAVFNTMLLFYNFIAAVGGIAFWLLFNDVITVWLGKEYLMDSLSVFAISLNFYLTNAISPIWMYRESNGLFNKVKYLMIFMAVCNIIFALILGRIIGVAGILLAPVLARIVTQVWYEPHILFNTVFQISQSKYWQVMAKHIALTLVSALLCWAATNFLPHSFMFVIVKGLLIVAICAVVFLLGNYKSDEFDEIKERAFLVFKKFKKK